jgi:lipoyl-dependent peroxiredoxin
MKIAYTAQATATGGRDGTAETSDGALKVKLATPKEMGGSGDGNNPEQLFAAGYSACFLGALKAAARKDGVKLSDDSHVTVKVGIGPRDDGTGFGLEADLTVNLPGMDRAQAEDLMNKAHVICPYSHATRGNIPVRLSVA